ncbi:hypothetical protein BKA67DRAFT_379333 [Truncatella angustata]|uniref:Uncharacterized protein n=1 Tax=Truncatella angustata TaxID=152316 RepID=A0A9P8UFM3_9PEZI|nr:uncharacterized protein BKA67DRAFT_379333 [Truncatella angustata]KAH6649009.1 hypothetical protein BKA67DRAFT_379333 [Truncatella angustata]
MAFATFFLFPLGSGQEATLGGTYCSNIEYATRIASIRRTCRGSRSPNNDERRLLQDFQGFFCGLATNIGTWSGSVGIMLSAVYQRDRSEAVSKLLAYPRPIVLLL